MKIHCQAKHDEDGGCYTCGGYGYVMEKAPVCVSCQREAWVRPGAYSIYEGKQFTTLDGVRITYGKNAEAFCDQCAKLS